MSVHQPAPVPGRHRLPDDYRLPEYQTPEYQVSEYQVSEYRMAELRSPDAPPGTGVARDRRAETSLRFWDPSAGTPDASGEDRDPPPHRIGPTLTTVAVPERTPTRVERQLAADPAVVGEAPFQAVFRATPTPLLLLSADSVVREANSAAELLTGRSAGQLLGVDAFSLFGDGLRLRAEVEQARRNGTRVVERGTTVVRSDASERPVSVSVATVRDPSGEPTHLVVHLLDRGNRDGDPSDAALVHSVTGLPSRTVFLERLNDALVTGHRHGTPTSVLVLEVTGLRRIDAEIGPDIADRAATELAGTLRAAVRTDDAVACLSAEVFVVVCRNTGPDEANFVADRLCVSTSGTISAHGRTVELNTTVRVFAADPSMPPATAFSSLLSEADAAIGPVRAAPAR